LTVSETERTTPDLLAVLAEPNRRRILELLRGGEQTVTELAAQFSVTRPAISQHLGVLAAAGLVEVRQDGRFRRYRLTPDGMAALRSILDSFWTSELEQLVVAEPPKKGNPHDD
jgi:DNA-binding transcriptional ArsR family regulator